MKRAKVSGFARTYCFGYGMAAAVRMQFQAASKAIVRMEADGSVVVRSDMTEVIGTGDLHDRRASRRGNIGLPLQRVRARGHPTIREVRDRADRGAPETACRLPTRASRCAKSSQTATFLKPGGGRRRGRLDDQRAELQNFSIYGYGAHFAEVGVDADTGEIRLRRMLGVFAAGRIFNAKTARSQLIGGMIFGVSAALHEEALVEPHTGAFLNRDLAGYLVPVHADIPEIDAVLLDDFDDKANVLGAKGVGELGNCV